MLIIFHKYACIPATSCLIGENYSFYSIYPVTVRKAGHYYCQIINQFGIGNSNIAMQYWYQLYHDPKLLQISQDLRILKIYLNVCT